MPTDEYTAYVAALQAVISLPKAFAEQVDSIERRAADELAVLDRSRNEAAQRWTGHRDASSRLARRINDLAGKVGAAPPSLSAPEPIPAAAIPTALESLRADLDRAEQSWQWLVRHRERERQVASAPPAPQPGFVASAPPPAPVPAPPAPPAPQNGVSPTVLLGIGAVVIVVLVIVIIVMAV